ncbi:hypothetical protein GEV33_010006 [Tenebrio molitor]|uniref:Uncharacterized protein n=1 Tax=Tenebrio molitor TaxID=7067 RepID=A0A8J6H6G1_TENMO|nr:hypothetical protein GEV33_010006 [Tenebrio molitor]
MENIFRNIIPADQPSRRTTSEKVFGKTRTRESGSTPRQFGTSSRMKTGAPPENIIFRAAVTEFSVTSSSRQTVDPSTPPRSPPETEKKTSSSTNHGSSDQSIQRNEFNPDQNISLVRARLEVARDAFEEFNKLHDEIEDYIPIADLDAENDERLIFEELFFNTISKLDSLLKANEMAKLTNQINQGAVVNSSRNDRIKLPTISLPEFSGSFEKWLSFRDSFIK